MAKVSAKSVPVDRDAWSDASKRSTAYGYAKTCYEDIHFRCMRCAVEACFSANEQKLAYETCGAYIWQRRMLCQQCFQERVALVKERNLLLRRWRNDRNSMSADRLALERLRTILHLLPSYGARKDVGNLAMLNKLLSEAA